jgi:hypothetical protein
MPKWVGMGLFAPNFIADFGALRFSLISLLNEFRYAARLITNFGAVGVMADLISTIVLTGI